MTEGGSAGSSGTTVGTRFDNRYLINMISEEMGADCDWAAGELTWRLHISSGNSCLKLEKVYVCRLNSSESSQETLGDDGTMNTAMNSGTYTGTIDLDAASAPASDDKLAIIYVFDNDCGGCMSQTMSWKPSQIINTPYSREQPSLLPGARWGMPIKKLLRTR